VLCVNWCWLDEILMYREFSTFAVLLVHNSQ
jgi:hypothetical protein